MVMTPALSTGMSLSPLSLLFLFLPPPIDAPLDAGSLGKDSAPPDERIGENEPLLPLIPVEEEDRDALASDRPPPLRVDDTTPSLSCACGNGREEEEEPR